MAKKTQLFSVEFKITEGEHEYYYHRTLHAQTEKIAKEKAEEWARTFWSAEGVERVDGAYWNSYETARIQVDGVYATTPKQFIKELTID